jgi:sulfite reductase alpha subunit-like flavoprotein
MDFPLTGKIPLTYLLDLIPWIRPRSFSIASSPEIDPFRIGLTVGIIEYTVPGMKSLRTGVCTQWMKRLNVGGILLYLWLDFLNINPVHVIDEFKFTITRGTLRLPQTPSTPVILIGPGTGIAPMRALLQTRIRQRAQENALFVGCRFSTKDYIYRGEWECHQSAGFLTLKPSFSRENLDDGKKEYVQNRVLKEKDWIWSWIKDRGAYIYISGNTDVPTGVRESLVQMAQDMEGWDLEDAEKFVKSELENTRRLQSETW